MKDLLGGKGAGLAEMTRSGVPVPAGFTVTTEVCRYYLKRVQSSVVRVQSTKLLPPGFSKEFDQAVQWLQKVTGKHFGDIKNPLLVSVRSGAKFSMPGMMDTILNLGINDQVVRVLEKGNARFSWDAYRRFIAMFSATAMGVDKKLFEEALSNLKKEKRVASDTDLASDDLKVLVERFKSIYRKAMGSDFPQEPAQQLKLAAEAVFRSWMNPRAQSYRKLNKISDDLGTAVNVVEMVFGNMGWDSGTGVGFTRNPSSGAKEFYGEYLANAQGEDVVAGIRTPKPLTELKKDLPKVYHQLRAITSKLERHYRDIQDFEFTIERGKLFMLQTRTGKRTARAALTIAVDMVGEKLITKKEALLRLEPRSIEELLKPIFDQKAKAQFKMVAKGLPAGPGAACGRVVFDAQTATREAVKGPVILVRSETNPDDILGMVAAQGILTQTGGLTSHAAVVGRGMGKVCVVGCEAIEVDERSHCFKTNGTIIREGELISLDGFTGEVMVGQVPLYQSEILSALLGDVAAQGSDIFKKYQTLIRWADESRNLGIRANADTPTDAKVARLLGAEGIGLCRTEHMFFGAERISHVVGMILAKSVEGRKLELDKLFNFQKDDFKAILKAMAPYPVTIRTLDPPLHEFLPKTLEEAQERAGVLGVDAQELWQAAREFHEANPMLGFRGVRLGIVYPEITAMQGRAIFSATAELYREGIRANPEVMIPLVGFPEELKCQRELLLEVKKEVEARYRVKLDISIGTMIEVPRAAVCADQIAQVADFLSFGTNDLTQMTLGFSRDDYGRFIGKYMEEKILAQDPFASLDISGVGRLIHIAISAARSAKKKIKIGVCGEHGGDPDSIQFFAKEGFDYVSSSPYRVPVAYLAAAQAKILESKNMKGSDTR